MRSTEPCAAEATLDIFERLFRTAGGMWMAFRMALENRGWEYFSDEWNYNTAALRQREDQHQRVSGVIGGKIYRAIAWQGKDGSDSALVSLAPPVHYVHLESGVVVPCAVHRTSPAGKHPEDLRSIVHFRFRARGIRFEAGASQSIRWPNRTKRRRHAVKSYRA